MSKRTFKKSIISKRIPVKIQQHIKEEKVFPVNKNMTTHLYEEDYPFPILVYVKKEQQPKRSRIVKPIKRKIQLSESSNII